MKTRAIFLILFAIALNTKLTAASARVDEFTNAINEAIVALAGKHNCHQITAEQFQKDAYKLIDDAFAKNPKYTGPENAARREYESQIFKSLVLGQLRPESDKRRGMSEEEAGVLKAFGALVGVIGPTKKPPRMPTSMLRPLGACGSSWDTAEG